MILLSWKQTGIQDPGLGRDRSGKASQGLWKSSQQQELLSYNAGAQYRD